MRTTEGQATTRHRLRAGRLAARVLAFAVAGLVLSAAPAAADPPAPGDYSSQVTSIDPPVDGIDIAVVGGDSFLELSVDPGVEVIVLGYDDEAFLRFGADGTVEQNENSPASYLNDDRYGDVDIPAHLAGADAAELDPSWEQVATGGRYAWHDHRVHWMAPNAPPAIPRGETFDWNGTVPLLVDGQRVDVDGTIRYHRDVNPLPWVAAGAIAAAAAAFALRRHLRAAAGAALVAAGAAVVAAWGTWVVAPAEAGASPLPIVLAAVAAVLAAAALVAPARMRALLLFAVAATLGAWGGLRFGVLTHPVLPTELPAPFDRAVTVTAIAIAVAVAVVALQDTGTPADER